ncbi:MAG: hypothetical protein ACK4ND_13945 [Cytophagaceae bacterium]
MDRDFGKPENDKLWNKGLSTGSAEEAGDFDGDSEITEKPKSFENKMVMSELDKEQPENPSATLPYEPEYDRIPTGTTGSNKQKVPGLDQ